MLRRAWSGENSAALATRAGGIMLQRDQQDPNFGRRRRPGNSGRSISAKLFVMNNITRPTTGGKNLCCV
jgi:hypothetical protein